MLDKVLMELLLLVPTGTGSELPLLGVSGFY